MYKWDKTKTDFQPSSKNFIDITGERYGRLVAEYPVKEGKIIKWICKCDCGYQGKASIGSLRLGNTTSCGCVKSETTVKKNKSRSKYIGDIPGYILGHIKYSAKIRNIDYDVPDNYLWELFQKQNSKCALSGLEIKFGRKYIGEEITASLDRVDSLKGYIESNVQWIHKDINYMKCDFDQDYFISMCKLIVEKK